MLPWVLVPLPWCTKVAYGVRYALSVLVTVMCALLRAVTQERLKMRRVLTELLMRMKNDPANAQQKNRYTSTAWKTSTAKYCRVQKGTGGQVDVILNKEARADSGFIGSVNYISTAWKTSFHHKAKYRYLPINSKNQDQAKILRFRQILD